MPASAQPVASLNVTAVDCRSPAWVEEISFRPPAGFPSPAQDHAVQRIDLNKVLIPHPAATYFVTVKGDSMRDAGIDDGDRLVVDRAVRPKHGHIVVAVIDGELTVKKLYSRNGIIKLVAANPTYPEIRMREESELRIWGVVTHCIKAMP
jgi:DNA polymerase V